MADVPAQENDVSVTDKLAAKSRRLAKDLHKAACLHALFGLLDGLNCSIGTLRCFFDLLCTESSLNSADVMHDWMMTPAGAAIAATEAVFITAFSLIANVFDDKDKDAFYRYIAIIWPYCRDTMKGLKNAYKGMRSSLQVASLLSGQDLRYLIFPVGLLLGVLSAMNRMWLRSMRSERIAMQKENKELLLDIQATSCLHLMLDIPEDKEEFKNSYILVGTRLYYVTSGATTEEVALNENDAKQFLISVENKRTKRLKTIKSDNKETLYLSPKEVRNLTTSSGEHMPADVYITEVALEALRSRTVRRQSISLRGTAILSAAYGGVVDGLYLYMGAMGLAVLAPPVFTTMMIFSTIFTLTCIATRTYEEYDEQRILVRTHAKVEFALCGKELEILFAQLQRISQTISNERSLPDTESPTEELSSTDELLLLFEQQHTMDLLTDKMKEFELKQAFLDSQLRVSYQAAALMGLRNGMAAYGAIAAAMFAVATINLVLLAPFPPVFLITCMIAGMACLIGFLAYALTTHYLSQRDKTPRTPVPNTKIGDLLELIKVNKNKVLDLKPEDVKDAIRDGMPPDPSPQFPVQELFEIFRSFCSGVKGQKSVDFILNPLQEPDAQGHYHDTSFMLWLSVASSTLYAVLLGLRAFARGFSKQSSDELENKKPPGIIKEETSSGSESPLPTVDIDPTVDIEDDEMRDIDNGLRSRAGSLPKERSFLPTGRRFATPVDIRKNYADFPPPPASQRFRPLSTTSFVPLSEVVPPLTPFQTSGGAESPLSTIDSKDDFEMREVVGNGLRSRAPSLPELLPARRFDTPGDIRGYFAFFPSASPDSPPLAPFQTSDGAESPSLTIDTKDDFGMRHAVGNRLRSRARSLPGELLPARRFETPGRHSAFFPSASSKSHPPLATSFVALADDSLDRSEAVPPLTPLKTSCSITVGLV